MNAPGVLEAERASSADVVAASEIEVLRQRVSELAHTLDLEAIERRASIEAALPQHRMSALNLAHYLGLRRQDVRKLQLELAAHGLSSLGRCEGHVRNTLDWLDVWLSGAPPSGAGMRRDYPDAAEAERLLHVHARELFGPRPRDRHVYIMVTAPEVSEATDAWADGLIGAGANVLRINAAHGSPGEWRQIIATFRARAQTLGMPVRVVIDLPGPKLRLDIRQRQQGVLHVRRGKDALGRTTDPAVMRLVARSAGDDQLPVPLAWLSKLQRGDTLRLTQPSGRRRQLTVRRLRALGLVAACSRSVYATSGCKLTWERAGAVRAKGRVGLIPDQLRRVALGVGDHFLVSASGRPRDSRKVAFALEEPALIAAVKPGERVIVDDGRIIAIVEANGKEGLRCRVTSLVKPSVRLRRAKGITFPDSDLVLDALGPADEEACAFALEFADAVGVSFVSTPADVARVGERIHAAGKSDFGMILKLETRSALRNLPAILFEALKYEHVGLMIARGDLAIDVGFERLAEMQEELLWFGEACHLPVVWATQVLETVAHTGLPTRAEVTDAAMSMRAECVMLNKGPYIATANRLLADIIRKMEAHQYKKRALYRPLSLAGRAPVSGPPA
jgi:pyruvate kinase